jgi:hypothetical protein
VKEAIEEEMKTLRKYYPLLEWNYQMFLDDMTHNMNVMVWATNPYDYKARWVAEDRYIDEDGDEQVIPEHISGSKAKMGMKFTFTVKDTDEVKRHFSLLPLTLVSNYMKLLSQTATAFTSVVRDTVDMDEFRRLQEVAENFGPVKSEDIIWVRKKEEEE